MHRQNRRAVLGLLVMLVNLPLLSAAWAEEGSAGPSSKQSALYSIFVAINVLRDTENPNRFYFYEIFRDQAAAEAHWETTHFATWSATVEGMIDGDFEMLGRMKPIFPNLATLEKHKPSLSGE